MQKYTIIKESAIAMVLVFFMIAMNGQYAFAGLFGGGDCCSIDLPEVKTPKVPTMNDVRESAAQSAGDFAEDTVGYRSTNDLETDFEDGSLQKLEQSRLGEYAGDFAETTTGYRSINDAASFEVPIPYTIPSTTLSGTVVLKGDLRNIGDTDVELTLAGFKATDLKLPSDNTIEQHYEATIEDMIRDLSSGTITEIDEGKEMINNVFGIQIGPLAKLKMDVSIKIPIPQSLTDVSQIQNIVPIPSLTLEGCYNKISNNLPDINDQEGVIDVIDDRNNAINQEDECTQLLNV